MTDAVVKEGRVQLRDAQGAAFSVPREEAADALSSGYRLELPEEFEARAIAKERGTLGQQALTVAESAAKGATLGLSTAALTATLGDDYRRAASERQAENPWSATAGEAIGAVGGTLATGGGGALGRAASLLPSNIVGKAAWGVGNRAAGLLGGFGGAGAGLAARAARSAVQLGVAGAVDDAAYGLGNSLAESALEGTEWTADRALAGMVDGAMYGLAGGAAVGAGGRVIGAAGRKVLDSVLGEGVTVKQAIKGFADNRLVRSAVGEDARVLREITQDGKAPQRIADMADKMRARGATGEAEDMLRVARQESADAIDTARRIEQSAAEAGVRPEASSLINDARERVELLRSKGTPEHTAAARQVEKRIAQLESSLTTTGKPSGILGLDGKPIPTQATTRAPTFEELRNFQDGIEQVSKKAKSTIVRGELGKLREGVASRLDEAAEALGPEAADAWRAANRDRVDFRVLSEGIENEIARKASRVPETTQATGIAAAMGGLILGSSGPMAALMGIATGVGHKLIRERGAAALGRLAELAARSEMRMNQAAKKIAFGSAEAGRARKFVAGKVSGRALREVAEESLAVSTGRALRDEVRDVVGAEATAGIRERAAIKAISVATPHGEKEQASRGLPGFAAIREHISRAQRDPGYTSALVERTIAPFSEEQPEVAVAMAARLHGDIAWLASKAPNPGMTPHSLTPLAEKGQVPRREQQRLTAYAEALSDPMSVFDSIADGRVSWDGIEALKARRPQLWDDMRFQVIQETAASENKIEPRRRALIGLAFDFPADWSMANVGTFQQIGTQEPDTGNGKPAMAGVSTDQNDLPGQSPDAP